MKTEERKMSCNIKQAPLKPMTEFSAYQSIRDVTVSSLYCSSCKLHGTPLCPNTDKTIYVQGAWPWDCMFCHAEKRIAECHTFANCPLLSAEQVERGCHGCPKLDADGTGEFCPHAVRHITVHPDNVGEPCDHYEFDPFFVDSQDLTFDTYWFATGYAVVKQAANEQGWLTLGDMLRNVSKRMLAHAAANAGMCPDAATRAWKEICKWADIAGYYASATEDKLVCRTPDEQTRHIRRLVVYICRLAQQRKKEHNG